MENLATRYRPSTLDEIVGQQHIFGKDKLLNRLIKSDNFGCLIFYGPPGTGKTSIANVIANTTNAQFKSINATTSGKAEMQKIIAEAEKNKENGKKTVLFVDEIHRFNKAQQDYLLPYTENGVIILIGATTENPYFEVNKAILSRSTVFELKPVTKEDIMGLLLKAAYDKEKGLGNYNPRLAGDAVAFLADMCGGDIRRALNALETGIVTTEPNQDGIRQFTLDIAKESIQCMSMRYDKNGDQHYDTVSAMIKSMRGSDPDAAVYYLTRILQSGEDVKYVARRIMIHASEDVGMADPQALCVATSAALAAERIGMPEAQIILTQAVIHIAMAPKSSSVINAVAKANEIVKKTGVLNIPSHLKDSHYSDAASLGHGTGYKYPHDYPNHYIAQQYLPDEIINEKIYVSSDTGDEKRINDYHKEITEQ